MAANLDKLRKEVFEPVRSEVPDDIIGKERYFLIVEVLDRLPERRTTELQNFLVALLANMEENGASDIDIGGNGCNDKVWYRIFGQKKPWLEGPDLSPYEADILCTALLTAEQLDTLLELKNLDFSYSIKTKKGTTLRFRADMYFDLDFLALNMRSITTEVRPFKNLNFHPEVAKALSLKYYKYGLTLVTGITGSGKSSTLDTIIDANNRSVDGHIVIISSPIEMVHTSRRCIVRHREVGRDTKSFKTGAIEALRQDPDIIVVGELRDAPTIMTALEITDSGHKTFSTLHTASATESIDRIIGEVPQGEQDRVRMRLADVLTCVISQKLVPTKTGKLVLAKEILLNTSSVKSAIKNNNTGEIYQMLMEGGNVGMMTMEQDLKRLFEEGIITLEEAYNQANNKKRLKDIIN
ncbi:MAG: Flp pilus assembly complex ATPase component TadA [Balneolales bacterium]|nr:Flp pilus assembly complex ATPase component TadA [Balneolales bacterium]